MTAAEHELLKQEPSGFPFRRGRLLIMALQFFAVGDESGIQDGAPYCLVCGYSGSAKEWDAFEPQWQSVLDDAGVERFHATEFFGRDRRGRRLGPYANWTDDDAARFLERLAGAINQRRLRPIGVAVDVAAFNGLTEGERRFLTGGFWMTRNRSEGRWIRSTGAPNKPYYLAFQYFLQQAARHSPKDAQINFLFDRQDVLEAHAVKVFKEIAERGLIIDGDKKNLRRLAFGSSRDDPALQAADLRVNTWYGTLTRENTVEAMGWERVHAMNLLTKKKKSSLMGVMTKEVLDKMLSGYLPNEVRKTLQDLA